MAFVPVISKGGGPWATKARVAITISKPYYGDLRHANIHLTRPVLDELNWRAADRMFVSLGVGDDFGKLQVARVKAGGSKLCTTVSKNNFIISFTIPELIGDMKRADFTALVPSRILCDYKVESGLLHCSLRPAEQAANLKLAS